MANFASVNSVNAIAILDAHTNRILQGYRPDGFIADDVFKKLPVDVVTARIPKTNAPLALNSQLELSPTGFPTIKLNFSATDYYVIKARGAQVFLEPSDEVQLGGAAQAKAITAYQLADYIEVQKEYALSNGIFSPSIMVQNFAPSAQYSDPGADPVSDFIKARSIVVGGIGSSYGCGQEPNVAIMNWQVFNYLSQHPALLKITFQNITDGTKQLDAAKLAQIMGVEKILIAKARYDASEPGPTATPYYLQLWPNHVLFAKIDQNPNPAMATQSLGYEFTPSGADMVPPDAFWQWTPPSLLPSMGQFYARMKAYDQHITNVYAGCLITNVLDASLAR